MKLEENVTKVLQENKQQTCSQRDSVSKQNVATRSSKNVERTIAEKKEISAEQIALEKGGKKTKLWITLEKIGLL